MLTEPTALPHRRGQLRHELGKIDDESLQQLGAIPTQVVLTVSALRHLSVGNRPLPRPHPVLGGTSASRPLHDTDRHHRRRRTLAVSTLVDRQIRPIAAAQITRDFLTGRGGRGLFGAHCSSSMGSMPETTTSNRRSLVSLSVMRQ